MEQISIKHKYQLNDRSFMKKNNYKPQLKFLVKKTTNYTQIFFSFFVGITTTRFEHSDMVASTEISEIFGFKYQEFQKYSDSNMVASNTEISEIFGFKYGRMKSGDF